MKPKPFFTHIDIVSLEKELNAINQQFEALEKQRGHLVGLLELAKGPLEFNKVVQKPAILRAVSDKNKTLKDRVIELLYSKKDLPIKDIVAQMGDEGLSPKEAQKLKSALYTVFNRNKKLFKNGDGRWGLTDSAMADVMLS